jgi:thymidylate synthase ThyX
MKIIKPSVEFYGAVPTDYEGALRFIEKSGRTCYKSEDKITPTSAEAFVRKLIAAGHLAMVEHSSFVVRMPQPEEVVIGLTAATVAIVGKFLNVLQNSDYIYVGGSLTAWYIRGNIVGWDDPIFRAFAREYDDLFDIVLIKASNTPWRVCPHDEIPKELQRYSAKFICDRGVSHELVRHRPCSFAQESTRYVNYVGKEMEFIEPDGFEGWPTPLRRDFEETCKMTESAYKYFIAQGLKPQQARAVLPNALKTEIVVTADVAEWQHLFNLRCAPSAHPDFRRLAVPLRDKFQEAGLI